MAGLITLGIGITIVLLSRGGPEGGIVVPKQSPSAAATPPASAKSSGLEPAVGARTVTPGTGH